MIVNDLASLQGYEKITGPLAGDQAEVLDAYTSDLLSDVIGNAPEDSLFITIQAHKNTVAVASLAGIPAILICSNRPIPLDMLKAAEDEGISLWRTHKNQFQASLDLGKILGL